jgi:hypothetical protein
VKIWISTDALELIEHFACLGFHFATVFAKESGAIAGISHDLRVVVSGVPGWHGRLAECIAMGVFGYTGQNRCSARGTDRRGDKRILEKHTVFCKAINHWCLHNRMSCAAQCVIALVVHEEKNDIRSIVGPFRLCGRLRSDCVIAYTQHAGVKKGFTSELYK